jgi:hypothetical protein
MKFINNKKNLCILDKIEILFSQLTKCITQYAAATKHGNATVFTIYHFQ